MKKDVKVMNNLINSKRFRTGIILFMMTGLVIYALQHFYMVRLPPGFIVGDYPVGRMTFSEFECILDELENRLNREQVRILFDSQDEIASFLLPDLGITLDKKSIRHDTEMQSARVSFLSRIIEPEDRTKINIYFNVKPGIFHKGLADISTKYHEVPRNAGVRAEAGELLFTPHSNGIELSPEEMLSQLLDELSIWPESDLKLKIKLRPIIPETSISDIVARGIKEDIVTKQTFFDPSAENRVHNIRLAAGKINNIIIGPGEMFSFNEIVGEASLEDGFKEAPVIINDQLVPAAGGGICQVSSTLYNAVLFAGIEIKERHNHGLTVNYLPPGYDAAVAYDYLDLKFINDKPHSLLIHIWVLENSLSAIIFGTRFESIEIKIIDQIKERISPPTTYMTDPKKHPEYRAIKQTGKAGYVVETFRVFYENGNEVEREFISRDYYTPRPEVIVVGPEINH